ncbi:hypothetical protein CDL12_10919 [Handroanthus impetiginosus]|uniref:Uncharacterized protein n=1 Tax=Handroanthus impetiginosus TaxID=429701 RepID=A0A2G9HFX0_9LAMI|nr:hypothetical protein CDL12_10919 [Handroanthus impetiginosus]
MVLLCFVLDLRSLSPPILRDLKQAILTHPWFDFHLIFLLYQSLLQLANYYAVSSQKVDNNFRGTQPNSKPLLDRIGLCYVLRNRISCSDELKIAYNPHGSFNLHDFHHAVNNLPTDAFFPESHDCGALYLKLADVLSEKVVYTWGGRNKNVATKVILISTCRVGTLDSVTMKALMDAADKSVLVEFILLEHTASHLGDVTENINHFVERISSLKHCSFQTCVPDLQVLYGLAKRWFQELKDDRKDSLQARFVFKTNLISAVNQISCNLWATFNPMPDEFIFCQTCRCHGIPLDHSNMKKTKSSSCPVTNDDLGAIDIIENSVSVGRQTILYMPSFQDRPKLKQVSSPIDLNVIQRTNLGSLSEGLIMGATYFVSPSVHDTDEKDDAKLNKQLFHVVCSVLNSLDEGLICSSTCNIETAMETSFRCYYILLPSDKGLMLLRRLSASEEFLPVPDVSQLNSQVVAEEIENKVQASLLKMHVSDYNPVQHERGFHKKLNLLVKESLQFGAILPKSKEGISESVLDLQSSPVPRSKQATGTIARVDVLPDFDTKLREEKAAPSLTEEWEQLIVTEFGGIHSPKCISNSKPDQLVISPSQSNRHLDEKTSRILERLEIPRQLKRKVVSPTISSNLSADVCAPTKKPLIPYKPSDAADQGPISSQPIKPSFQRIKRKR